MKTIMFYSYKGGSGRTVAVANVSAAMAKLGKRVAVIDLDFEAPGLHHVFGAAETPQFRDGNGIQHYLRGDIELPDLEKRVYIDLFGKGGPLTAYPIPPGGKLLFILASPKVAKVDPTDPQVGEKMRLLISSLEKQAIEYTIIDAASGVRDAYAIAADVSNEMLMFFRWSTQHVEGTIRMANYMKLLKEFDQPSIPFRLVASASPREGDLGGGPKAETYSNKKRETVDRIRAVLTSCHVSPPEPIADIKENAWLKWRESVIVCESDEDTEYDQLARKLVEESGAPAHA